MYKLYEDNEVKADKTYKGKTILVSGEVTEIGVSFGQTYVVLSSGEDFSLTNIQCFFKNKSEVDKVAELSNGDTISIQGIVEGKSMNVSVNKCVLK